MSQSIQPPIWQPSDQRRRHTQMWQFKETVASQFQVDLPDTAALHAWSVQRAQDFWELAFEYAVQCGDRGTGSWQQKIANPPGAQFFLDSQVCYAEELLNGANRAQAQTTAVISLREDGHRLELSWQQLRAWVAMVAAQLRAAGIQRGDRVAAWVPNTTTALVGMLAANSLGAVYTSASPDFGPVGVIDRFGQVAPKVLIMSDGYWYGQKVHDRTPLLSEVLAGLDTVTTVLLAPELGIGTDHIDVPPAVSVQSLATLPSGADGQAITGHKVEEWAQQLQFVRLSAQDPAFILYSSGTTGKPKCIVHGATGLLVKHWTEHALHCDVKAGDVVFYYTTCGWMMWNWLVSALALGATIVLYDGSPFATPTVLWDLAETYKVTLFGTSAKYLAACRQQELRPARTHDLSKLRTLTSTGSPLAAADFEYVYQSVHGDVHLASISGGTDICGCFVLGDPTAPVFLGEIQMPALGVATDVVNCDGDSLHDQPGVQGDLVCRAAMPSMPLQFWHDADFERYRQAYFAQIPHLWTHGDFANWTTHGGIVISGRSDATLNAGGVRIGTAEIYRHLTAFPEISDAVVVGRVISELQTDSEIVLFVVLSPDLRLTTELTSAIKRQLRTYASPRHVPTAIYQVPDLPRTRSGKVAELAVADVVNGRPVRNTEALANPDSLGEFDQFRLIEN